jgi:DNA-binding MarR family transcriptional regulator
MTDRATDPAPTLRDEIQQTRPFRSDAQEAALALLRTASVVSRHFARVVEPHGLSLAQYNVLRILRGAGAAGLPTLAIRDRMIDEGSTVTRLLDKLEQASLVTRDRRRPDRRQVLCQITPAGDALLAALDPDVDAADAAATAMLSHDERHTLVALLSAVRNR